MAHHIKLVLCWIVYYIESMELGCVYKLNGLHRDHHLRIQRQLQIRKCLLKFLESQKALCVFNSLENFSRQMNALNNLWHLFLIHHFQDYQKINNINVDLKYNLFLPKAHFWQALTLPSEHHLAKNQVFLYRYFKFQFIQDSALTLLSMVNIFQKL